VEREALEPDLTKWDAWQPGEVAKRLSHVEAPWYVAAGWAIDLFLGGEGREHDDLEIAVPQARFQEVVDALDGLELFVVGVPRRGLVSPLEHATDALEANHQTWVRDTATGAWRLDIMREPSDGVTWICRRDQRIRMPYDQVIERTPDAIPYGRPEIILLFKAKQVRAKDEADFEAVLPGLDAARREWLADALELVHPGHPWLERLKAR
jgi:Aminoglycoside-2''-adenylyltransferase